MSDVWHAIVDSSGNLVSLGTVIADQGTLSAQGYTAIALASDPSGMTWNPATRVFDIPATRTKSYPKLVFIQRFTADEFVAFKNSTDTQILFFMYQLDHCVEVVPQDPTVQGALGYAVSIGLLAPGRATEIGAN